MAPSAEFGQWVADDNYRDHRTSLNFHPFAQVESGNMTQGAESFFALVAIASRAALLGAFFTMKALGRLSVRAVGAAAACRLKLAVSRPDPAIRRYSSWGVRS